MSEAALLAAGKEAIAEDYALIDGLRAEIRTLEAASRSLLETVTEVLGSPGAAGLPLLERAALRQQADGLRAVLGEPRS